MIYPPAAVKSSCTDSYVDDTKIYCPFSAKNNEFLPCKNDGRPMSHWLVVLLTPVTDKSKQKQLYAHSLGF